MERLELLVETVEIHFFQALVEAVDMEVQEIQHQQILVLAVAVAAALIHLHSFAEKAAALVGM
jgi:hypothetical protein